jgi:hypothetical protein
MFVMAPPRTAGEPDFGGGVRGTSAAIPEEPDWNDALREAAHLAASLNPKRRYSGQ